MTEQTIEIFFSYAHEDEALRDEFAEHLKLLERQGIIKAWHDRNITAGEEWKTQPDWLELSSREHTIEHRPTQQPSFVRITAP